MKVKRLLTNALGFLFLAIGAIGLFMPLLPTTPFVLLATVCFSYSNRRVYEWLKRTPFFGSFIVNFEEKQGVPMSLKITSIILVWASLAFSMIALRTLWAYILLSIIGIGVTIHLLMLKTKKPMQYTIFNGAGEQNANDAILEKTCH